MADSARGRADLPPLNRLMGSLFRARPTPPAPDAPRRPSPSSSARWAAAQQRHEANTRKCQLIDARLGSVHAAVGRQRDAARDVARELALVPGARRQLEALQAEAAALQPALAALEQLYGALAAAANAEAGPGALAQQQEAAHRQARHSHYQQIQCDMDAQYADACRTLAHQRAASAARSFQHDLDDYRRGAGDHRPGGARPPRASPAGSAAVADVVLAPSIAQDRRMEAFLGGGPAQDARHDDARGAPQRPGPPGDGDGDDDEPPAFAVLADEDFDGG
ncbi:hypothetical protein LPJ61_000959 [Coemansia biformis]|uniref:Uncharacterized protein n=1 Tax=Coemansia biformis TaxID=1286918 RepID=A0A9W7YHC9_9FUNG|nr:hypothetical protein LPJ61_000959 [Coemansia biformis]